MATRTTHAAGRDSLPDTSLFARPAHAGPRAVLVVDDDATIRTVMTLSLQQANYTVYTAADGRDAFNLLHEFARARKSLDCMLLDMHMPGLDGIGLLDEMMAAGMVLPVIACTGDASRDVVLELMRRGVGDLLEKPIRTDDLLRTVGDFIARADRLAERRRAREVMLKAEAERLASEREVHIRKAQEASDSFSRLEAQVVAARAAWRDLVGVLTPPPGIDLAYRLKPLADMGGDFVGLNRTERGCVLLVADVAGHDLGASLHSVLIKAFFEENCRQGRDGHEFLSLLNRQLLQSSTSRRLVTAQLVTIDLEDGRVELCGAGHPPALVQRGAQFDPCAGGGSVLGIADDPFIEVERRDLQIRDRLWLVTDGVLELPRVEGRSGERRRLGVPGLIEILRGGAYDSLDRTVARVWNGLLDWSRRKVIDDMFLLGLERSPPTDEYEPSEGHASRPGLAPRFVEPPTGPCFQ